jgi:uncharacterized peroxidase-related enzyme
MNPKSIDADVCPRLPECPELGDVFRVYPAGVPALLDYHDILLRGPSPLTVAQRELIAAYVSGLNACAFCFGAHRIIAETFGVPQATLEALVADPELAAADPPLRPLLHYVGKLTRAPASVRAEDREAVFAAGWSERALHDAVAVCALFNFMNRLVEGMGVKTSPAIQAAQRARHQQAADQPNATPYTDFGRRLGLIPRA